MAAAVPQYKQTLISAATTGQGYSDCSSYNNLAIYVTASAALSAGTLIIEESPDRGLTSAWSNIYTVDLSTPFVSAGGVWVYHAPLAAYAYVKARIGTTVVGGTLTVELRAN